MRKYPDRLIGFGRIDPRYGSEITTKIERLASAGIKGIKLHPVVESFYPDHPFFFPVYKSLPAYGIRLR